MDICLIHRTDFQSIIARVRWARSYIRMAARFIWTVMRDGHTKWVKQGSIGRRCIVRCTQHASGIAGAAKAEG